MPECWIRTKILFIEEYARIETSLIQNLTNEIKQLFEENQSPELSMG